jgi:hypothetical protein
VQFSSLIDAVSKRSPSIVVYTLGVSLLCAWVGAPVWAVTALGVVIAGLALLLLAARGGGHPGRGINHDRNWLAWEVAGQGTPPGSYLLAFFGFLAIFLIGFDSAYARPAWAAFALAIAWGIANRQYPADEEADL